MTLSHNTKFKGNVSNGNPDQWTSFALTASGDAWPIVGSGEFGFLYRNNTGIQIFNNGVAMEGFGSTTGGDNFAFYLADSAGTGSPFAGNGTRVIVMQGGNILGSYELNTGMGTRQITFRTDGGLATGMVGGIDTSFGGVISGALAGIVKNGLGTLTLSAANTYTGMTTIAAGMLRVARASPNKLEQADFTPTSLTVMFRIPPLAGETYRLFPGATAQAYPTVMLVGATGRTASYNSATSTLTVS